MLHTWCHLLGLPKQLCPTCKWNEPIVIPHHPTLPLLAIAIKYPQLLLHSLLHWVHRVVMRCLLLLLLLLLLRTSQLCTIRQCAIGLRCDMQRRLHVQLLLLHVVVVL